MEELRIVRLASVNSTQEVARELPIGSIVVADHQTAGRGRLDRRWEAPPGSALLASFVLEPHPLLSLAAGVAAAEACGPDVRLKWPNDLMLRGRKLGGILVEVGGGKAVVGIGINLTSAPPGAARLGRLRDELLDRLRAELSVWTSASSGRILDHWRELSVTLGRHVRVALPGHTFEGIAQDIAEDGALVVDGQRIGAGDVIHLRQRGPAARSRAAPRPSARG
ncbi:MAG: biotin--[acetyl-CoA-carboxylase] ligase [Chloroflexi bacterium]|nr:MAG: biotin--[acetyl-CoA-carboxylase] ligase [Chloroflexota bacterium]TMF00111.1 MAG: biotin--[acetyl-CoA-carboxylase] ligase [Chloroflexota bacterium]